METVAGNALKVTMAQNERSRQAVRARWVHGVEGPLEKAAGTYENAWLYKPRRTVGEARQLMADIALNIRVNELPSLDEADS